MSGSDMTDDEFSAAFLGGVQNDERAETRRQVEQFKRARPEATAQLRQDLADAKAEAIHDQLDSAEWLADQLTDLLSREGRKLDADWREEVKRTLRVLCTHFEVANWNLKE